MNDLQYDEFAYLAEISQMPKMIYSTEPPFTRGSGRADDPWEGGIVSRYDCPGDELPTDCDMRTRH